MFRAFVFVEMLDLPPEAAVRWTCQAVQSLDLAIELLEAMQKLPTVKGGDIEVQVAGVGWCLHDTSE